MKINTVLYLLILTIIGCNNPNKVVIADKKVLPKDLNEAIVYLKKEIPATELSDFKNQNEGDAVASQHFSTGLWIRNNWIRGSRDTALVEYFDSIGKFHNPDEISGVILISLHRNLNKRDIDLKGQLKAIESSYKPMSDCLKKSRQMAVYQYNSHKIGSHLTILMMVDTADKHRNAETYECPNTDWTFNSKKDLKINGTITDKYNINSKDNVFFKIQINRMNYPNTEILSEKVKVGDIIDFHLENLTILN